MGKTSGLRPGEKTPVSGQYQEIGPRGGKGPEVTMPKGHVLPPTSQSGSSYKLVDKTKHRKK